MPKRPERTLLIGSALPTVLLLAAGGARAPDGGYAGAERCLECHYSFGREWTWLPHSTILMPREESGLADSKCEACHGPGSNHINGPRSQRRTSIVNPKRLDKKDSAEVCLECHQDPPVVPASLWREGIHANASRKDVTCVTCHEVHEFTVHDPMLRKSQDEMCLECHESIAIEAELGLHHRIRASADYPAANVSEGPLNCTRCHDPHGTRAPHLLQETVRAGLCRRCHVTGGPKPMSHATILWGKQHGEKARDDKSECLKCHQWEEFCVACHGIEDIPHPDEWVGGKTLHKLKGSFQDNSACFNCHARDWCLICHREALIREPNKE